MTYILGLDKDLWKNNAATALAKTVFKRFQNQLTRIKSSKPTMTKQVLQHFDIALQRTEVLLKLSDAEGEDETTAVSVLIFDWLEALELARSETSQKKHQSAKSQMQLLTYFARLFSYMALHAYLPFPVVTAHSAGLLNTAMAKKAQERLEEVKNTTDDHYWKEAVLKLKMAFPECEEQNLSIREQVKAVVMSFDKAQDHETRCICFMKNAPDSIQMPCCEMVLHTACLEAFWLNISNPVDWSCPAACKSFEKDINQVPIDFELHELEDAKKDLQNVVKETSEQGSAKTFTLSNADDNSKSGKSTSESKKKPNQNAEQS